MDKALLPTPPTSADAREWSHAVESGDAAAVESLVASGARVDAAFDKGETALMRASARGYADVAQVLLDAGANVNARREDGFTPLILAVFFGHEDVVRLLLDAGADASAQTKLGTTAEKWAASRGFKEIVELLKEAAAASPARPPEPDNPPHVETEEATPVKNSSFKPQAITSETSKASVEQQGPPSERAPAPVEQQELKARMEALFASSPVGAANTADGPISTSFINDAATNNGATSERPRAEEISPATLDTPDEPDADSSPTRPAPSSGSRFRRVLQSWPVSAGAVLLIVASGASVFLLQRGAESPNARPAPTATGAAPQPVVPQTLPLSTDAAPQPSPTTTPEVAQPLIAPPGTYDSFPFTPGPQESVVSSGPPSTAGNAPSSNVPSVVSESGGGGRTPEGDAPRARASDAESRETNPNAAPTRAAREGEDVDEGSASGTPARGSQPRTGVETRRATTPAPPSSLVNTPPPAPTPAERRKVIQWP